MMPRNVHENSHPCVAFICLSPNMYFCLSVCLSICLSIYLSFYLSPSLSLFVNLCVSLFPCLSIHSFLSVLSLSPLCQFVRLCVCHSVCLCVCVPVYLFACLSAPLSLSLCVSLFPCLSIHSFLSVSVSLSSLSICLSTCPSVRGDAKAQEYSTYGVVSDSNTRQAWGRNNSKIATGNFLVWNARSKNMGKVTYCRVTPDWSMNTTNKKLLDNWCVGPPKLNILYPNTEILNRTRLKWWGMVLSNLT